MCKPFIDDINSSSDLKHTNKQTVTQEHVYGQRHGADGGAEGASGLSWLCQSGGGAVGGADGGADPKRGAKINRVFSHSSGKSS